MDKTQPQADDKGLSSLLADAIKVTDQIIAEDTILATLRELQQDNGILELDRDFSITTGDKAGEFIDTTGKVLLEMHNNSYQLVNLATYTLSNQKIEIIDPNLLIKTNGIIPGMSGSPIIQDGKLVGAVTHVLVNNPTRGYGIFIDNMLDAEK